MLIKKMLIHKTLIPDLIGAYLKETELFIEKLCRNNDLSILTNFLL